MKHVIAGLFAVALTPAIAIAEGDAAAGEKAFRKCMACHQVGASAENKAGPILNGIVGRTIGTGADFTYSPALLALGEEGKIWTEEELAAFLEAPKKYVAGTKMSFAGLRKEADRANIIAYLASFE